METTGSRRDNDTHTLFLESGEEQFWCSAERGFERESYRRAAWKGAFCRDVRGRHDRAPPAKSPRAHAQVLAAPQGNPPLIQDTLGASLWRMPFGLNFCGGSRTSVISI